VAAPVGFDGSIVTYAGYCCSGRTEADRITQILTAPVGPGLEFTASQISSSGINPLFSIIGADYDIGTSTIDITNFSRSATLSSGSFNGPVLTFSGLSSPITGFTINRDSTFTPPQITTDANQIILNMSGAEVTTSSRLLLDVSFAALPPPPPPSTFADVISNSVSVSLLPGNQAIEGKFTPKLGLSLKQAAELGGYDHFNWLNIITADTLVSTGLGLVCGDLTDQQGKCPTIPYVDPALGGYKNQVTDCADITGAPCTFPVADSLPWFWDEQEFYDPSNLVSAHVFGNSLLFLDAPSTGLGFNVSFKTSLVGVRSDGTGDILSFPGTYFEWESVGSLFGPDSIELRLNLDISRANGTLRFGGFLAPGEFTADELELFTRLGIGIRGVPEPSSISLLGLALLLTAFWMSPSSQRQGLARRVAIASMKGS
jgi:hypothetical protein